MKNENFNVSSFGLAKGKNLVSDDFFAVRVIDDICIGIVCDGVGSAEAGEIASRHTVNYMMNNFKTRPRSWNIEKSLRHFVQNINRILYQKGIEDYERAEYVTTLSIVVIDGDRLYGANVGDSPIFLMRHGALQQLSFSHNSDEAGMEHVLTQAIGLNDDVDPYLFENNLEIGDKILICSDGLEAVMSRDEISHKLGLQASSLIKYASKKVKDDLPDDTSAVIIEVNAQDKKEILKKIDLPIPESLKKDQIIDGYCLKKSLVQNDRTWLCEKKGVRYVLKFPPIEAIDDQKYLDIFIKEAWNAIRLKAGFFPKAVIPKKRSKRYYVMEYLDGKSLKETIKKRPITSEDAMILGKFLLHTCNYLLKFDLVHGDIKPENILVLERRGKRIYKLIDFGSIVEVFSINSKAGTPSYLAPERFLSDPISEQTEIFAIGVTLYESLTKKYPYGEIEPFQTPVFKKSKPVHLYNKTVPLWFEAVIMRASARKKERRYEVYSEMEYELAHPEKVKAFYPEDETLLQREPVMIYRWLFILSFIINLFLAAMLMNR